MFHCLEGIERNYLPSRWCIHALSHTNQSSRFSF